MLSINHGDREFAKDLWPQGSRDMELALGARASVCVGFSPQSYRGSIRCSKLAPSQAWHSLFQKLPNKLFNRNPLCRSQTSPVPQLASSAVCSTLALRIVASLAPVFSHNNMKYQNRMLRVQRHISASKPSPHPPNSRALPMSSPPSPPPTTP